MWIDAQELARRIAGREGQSLEFKRGLPGDAKVARVLSGFANARGGLLVIGVEDRGRAVGVERSGEVARELRRIAATRLRPALGIELQELALAREDGGRADVVVARIPRRPGALYAALDVEGRERVWLRRGSATREAAPPEGAATGGQEDAIAFGAAEELAAVDPLAAEALAWIAAQPEPADPIRFAASISIGAARARRMFEQLDRHGYAFGCGAGAGRRYRAG